MKDIIEHLESIAEANMEDMFLPGGKAKCRCGRIFDVDDFIPISANPYSTPVCPVCFDEYIQKGADNE